MSRMPYGNALPNLRYGSLLVGGVAVVAGCLLGIATVTGTSGTATATVALGCFSILLLTLIGAVAIDVPLIGMARALFIASFFFKADINLFKVDDLEDPSGLNISLTLLIAAGLFAYDLIHETRQERVFPLSFSWLLLAVYLAAAASVLNGGLSPLGLFSLFSLGSTIFIAYVIASHFSRPERVSFLITCLAAGILITGVAAVTQYLFDFPTGLASLGTGTEDEMLGTQSELLSRVPAFLRTPTEMAWVISAVIPVVLSTLAIRVYKGRGSREPFLVVCALAGVGGMLLSLARGSWIALGVAAVIIFIAGVFKSPANKRSKYVSSVMAALIVGAIALAPFYGRVYDRLTGDDEGSAEIRLPMVENATRMIEDNLIFGVGLNGYRAYMTRYDETGIFVSQVFPNPVHNVFAHITAETGIVGGALFCLLIVFGVYEGIRNGASPNKLLAAASIGVAIGLIAFAISGLKEPGSLGSARPPIRACFMLLGTVMAVSRIRRRQDLSLTEFPNGK